MRSVRGELMTLSIPIIVGLAMMIVASALGIIYIPSPWTMAPMLVINACISIGIPVMIAWRCHVLRRHLATVDGRICPACGQSLVDLGDTGTCPECGNAFEIDAVRKRWRQIVGEQRPPGTPTLHIPKSAIVICLAFIALIIVLVGVAYVLAFR